MQRIVNDLHKEGLVAFVSNAHHRRAQLVVLTNRGRQTFEAAMRLRVPWINSLLDGLLVEDIETVHRVMMALRKNWKATMNLKNKPDRYDTVAVSRTST